MTVGLSSAFEVATLEELGRLDTPIHRIEARAKIITTLGFLITVMSFSRYEIAALLPFFAYPAVVAAIGRVPYSLLGRKILIASPVALLIGIFNPLIDTRAVEIIGPISIGAGWLSFLSVILRFVLTVAAAVLLVASTGAYRLCAGLEKIGLPQALVVQTLLLYRYLFVLSEETLGILRSVRYRSAGRLSLSLRVYGSLVGCLLLRSISRAERIYCSMVSRGFTGEIRIWKHTPFRKADLAYTLGWLCFFCAARAWNLSDLAGRLLSGG